MMRLFSGQAWVFAAFDDPARAPLYYSFSALYLLPLLRNGLQIDSTTLAWLALGALHVQVCPTMAPEPRATIDTYAQLHRHLPPAMLCHRHLPPATDF